MSIDSTTHDHAPNLITPAADGEHQTWTCPGCAKVFSLLDSTVCIAGCGCGYLEATIARRTRRLHDAAANGAGLLDRVTKAEQELADIHTLFTAGEQESALHAARRVARELELAREGWQKAEQELDEAKIERDKARAETIDRMRGWQEARERASEGASRTFAEIRTAIGATAQESTLEAIARVLRERDTVQRSLHQTDRLHSATIVRAQKAEQELAEVWKATGIVDAGVRAAVTLADVVKGQREERDALRERDRERDRHALANVTVGASDPLARIEALYLALVSGAASVEIYVGGEPEADGVTRYNALVRGIDVDSVLFGPEVDTHGAPDSKEHTTHALALAALVTVLEGRVDDQIGALAAIRKGG